MAFNLEKEALIASGIKEGNQLKEYAGKLDLFHQKASPAVRGIRGLVARGRTLFDWLWTEKPARYKLDHNYRLDEVIDAQMSEENQPVGNCLGLTLLYNCLLRRMGINTEALYLEDAFGTGPHVLTVLRAEGSSIDVENIVPDGFDYKGHLHNPSRTRWRNRQLVADIYHSQGNVFFESGEFIEALKSYEMAINLNPKYEKAHLNRAIVLAEIGGGEKGTDL
jgi:tetratricopeptide (TPR) repeat protein